MDCIFCGIADGTIPATIVFSDDQVVAFRDIHPVATTHILVVPRRHMTSIADATSPADELLLGHLLFVAKDLAVNAGLDHGYRLVINTGAEGGQTVGHLHLHLIGGRSMHWPPG